MPLINLITTVRLTFTRSYGALVLCAIKLRQQLKQALFAIGQR